MLSAELFAGCGGLALGISRAGFKHAYMAEFDYDAVKTVLHNKLKGVEHVRDWPMGLKDVREIDWEKIAPLDLVSGGPPCQPFGIGGKKLGQDDHRDMWPEAIRAVREATPRMFLFENVRNLAGPRFRSYLNWIIASLERPALARRVDETYETHLARLDESKVERDYRVVWQLANAADFGAAQIRHRVLIFGIHADLNVSIASMNPTHSRDRLLWEQFVTEEYWMRHHLQSRKEPFLVADRRRVAELKKLNVAPLKQAWRTVRDELAGLGEPDGKQNHVLQPGARVYRGHTGSLLDLPAKALKAGDHGVPGGENMIVQDDGTVRYLTIREAARLVGLPDDFEFPRSWTESMRQLGNAVPVQLGSAAGCWLVNLVGELAQPSLVSNQQAA